MLYIFISSKEHFKEHRWICNFHCNTQHYNGTSNSGEIYSICLSRSTHKFQLAVDYNRTVFCLRFCLLLIRMTTLITILQQCYLIDLMGFVGVNHSSIPIVRIYFWGICGFLTVNQVWGVIEHIINCLVCDLSRFMFVEDFIKVRNFLLSVE